MSEKEGKEKTRLEEIEEMTIKAGGSKAFEHIQPSKETMENLGLDPYAVRSQCDWVCPELGCNGRCGGVSGHYGPHQCPVHHRAVRHKALDSRVLVVAKQGGHPKQWTCYIGAVPGLKHTEEWQDVAAHGSTLSYELAKALFPSFARSYKYVG